MWRGVLAPRWEAMVDLHTVNSQYHRSCISSHPYSPDPGLEPDAVGHFSSSFCLKYCTNYRRWSWRRGITPSSCGTHLTYLLNGTCVSYYRQDPLHRKRESSSKWLGSERDISTSASTLISFWHLSRSPTWVPTAPPPRLLMPPNLSPNLG